MKNDYVSMMERESLALVDSIDHDPLIGSVIRGDASREDYVGFLAATYHYLRWSGPLLSGAAEGLRRSGRCPWLLEVFDTKADEESPHVRWVLDDLARCGEDVQRVIAAADPIAVNAYVHWSWTTAEEGSPAFLGAAYTLEFISMHRAKMAAENLRVRRAIPDIENAVSFLDGHGDADFGHIAALNDILRRIEDPRDQGAILLSAEIMCALYPRFFQPGRTGGAHFGGPRAGA
jgi:hypothetical protein